MSVTGVGVDIVSIERMQTVLTRTPAFVKNVFTEQERHYCEHKARPAAHYAARFAAREAVLKALGIGFLNGVAFDDVEVVREESGKPQAVLHGKAKQVAEEKGVVAIHLSLSLTNDVAVANALAITEDAIPKKEEKVDPVAEMQAQFKEVRSVLDELERYQVAKLEEQEQQDDNQESGPEPNNNLESNTQDN